MRRTTVLIVEDDPALRDLYRTTLKAAGYAVVAVADGVDALRVVELGAPDAIVLDMHLPRLSGSDVHDELASRQETCSIPIVVVIDSDAVGIDEATFTCVLRKPVHPELLVYAIENCLRGGSRIA